MQNQAAEAFSAATNSRRRYGEHASLNLRRAVPLRTRREQALKKYPGLPVVFSGGVASNSMLRQRDAGALTPCSRAPQYSTDNAMGIAVLTAGCRRRLT